MAWSMPMPVSLTGVCLIWQLNRITFEWYLFQQQQKSEREKIDYQNIIQFVTAPIKFVLF